MSGFTYSFMVCPMCMTDKPLHAFTPDRQACVVCRELGVAFDFRDDRFAVVLGRPPTRAEFAAAVGSEVMLVNVMPAPRLTVNTLTVADAFNVWTDGWLRAAGLERSDFMSIVWAFDAPAGLQQPTLMDEAKIYMRRARAVTRQDSLWSGRIVTV